MSSEVTARLEAVAARLEAVAARLGGGDATDEDGTPIWVTDYENIFKTEVKNAVDASNALGIPKAGDMLLTAYKNNLALIKKVPKCKKPDSGELMEFLKPGSDAIKAADTLRYKGKQFKTYKNHYTAMYEAIVVISWVTQSPPWGNPLTHVDGQAQSCEFSLNRVLKDNKDEKTKTWIAAMKALNNKVKEFVKNNFKTGLSWNPKGGSLDASGGDTAEEEKEEPAPKKTAPKKTASKNKGGAPEKLGMAGVFADLNKGTAITKGMKKVTASMKTKNRKNRAGKVTVKAKKAKARKKFGAAETRKMGGRWVVQNYDDGLQEVQNCSMKENVFITTCDNCTINITAAKVKAITIDNCVKCRIYFQEVISTVEMVNCKSVQIFVQGKAASLAVDKCESASIILSRSAYESNPDIYTSNVTAMNIEVPGATDTDNSIEYPVPEQFLTKIDPATGKMTTTNTEH